MDAVLWESWSQQVIGSPQAAKQAKIKRVV